MILLLILIYIVVCNLLLIFVELLGVVSYWVGDGDLLVYLFVYINDEVGVLFNDFNYMVN